MIPQASTHIDNFTRAYNAFGYYLLAPGGMNEMKQPNIIFDQGIVKRKIYFKNAWEIGSNDMDCASIKPTDHPLIPPEIKNPLVAELLEILKKQ